MDHSAKGPRTDIDVKTEDDSLSSADHCESLPVASYVHQLEYGQDVYHGVPARERNYGKKPFEMEYLSGRRDFSSASSNGPMGSMPIQDNMNLTIDQEANSEDKSTQMRGTRFSAPDCDSDEDKVISTDPLLKMNKDKQVLSDEVTSAKNLSPRKCGFMDADSIGDAARGKKSWGSGSDSPSPGHRPQICSSILKDVPFENNLASLGDPGFSKLRQQAGWPEWWLRPPPIQEDKILEITFPYEIGKQITTIYIAQHDFEDQLFVYWFPWHGTGSLQCYPGKPTIKQVTTGKQVENKPEWNVTVANECPCVQTEVKLSLLGFQTVEKVDPSILVVDGSVGVLQQNINPFSGISFTYAWDTSKPITPLSSQENCS
ncbi:hypothetical protein RJ639_001962 [Escallonia herrerae]|uniref:Uncharacterized protein n=1 Tax=Escallonia herrerae TaxID=1293975 RepID=A0AA88XCR4_9ASTE|nr:hypothetical protein RJ639_001962 [Escallonia herrerae]